MIFQYFQRIFSLKKKGNIMDRQAAAQAEAKAWGRGTYSTNKSRNYLLK